MNRVGSRCEDSERNFENGTVKRKSSLDYGRVRVLGVSFRIGREVLVSRCK